MRPKTPLADRWASYVTRTQGCWLWVGPRLPAGYGCISAGGRGGKRLYAHRVAWELYRGEIPSGLFVCHHCDTPSCVNPDHLFLGTARDNARDCQSKGRQAPVDVTRHVGVDNGRAKLSEADVAAIRERYAALPRKQRVRRGSLSALAAQYGISTVMVLLIAKKKNWAHVTEHHCADCEMSQP